MWDTNRVWSSLSSDIPYAGASLAFGTTYYWKAMTWSNDGSSSPYCSAQTFKTTTRPTSFSGVAVSTHSIMWTWHDNCNDACSYEVYAGTSALSGALGQDTTSWQEKGLISNTRYTRHVRITGPDGELSSDAGTRYTLANPPQNLTALADDIGDHRVTLQWSGEGGSRFGVARSSSSGTGPWTWIAGWPDNITRSAYTDEDAIFANTTYWYRVRGYNGDGIATTPTAVISVLTKPDVTAPLPPVITISLLPGETGIRRNGTIIIGGSANGEPELVISRVKVFDQDGNELTLGVEQIDVRIGWTDGIISGYIIIGDIKKHYPMVTAITIQVEIEDDNGAGYHFFVTGQSNALAISGESIRLNAYENLINPINGDRTYIRIELVEDCNVTLRVCNLAGDTVRTIINSQPMYAGVHTGSTWDGRNEQGDNVASGIYLLYLDAGGRKQWKKVAVIKE